MTQDMLERCRMDGGVDRATGYKPAPRAKVQPLDKVDLEKKLTLDNMYEPHEPESNDDAALPAVETPPSAAASAAVPNSDVVPPPPAPSTTPRSRGARKQPIRGQALTALPSYRRIKLLQASGPSTLELSSAAWIQEHCKDAWQVQARAMLHICGPSCWKYNKTGTKICRHHCHHIVILEPDTASDAPADGPLKMRRDGRPLNNQLFIIEDDSKGKRGRIYPIIVLPFETVTNYIVAAALRCNFDNQSLVYLPPASVLPLEWLPNIGPKPDYASMARHTGDLEAKWFVPDNTEADAVIDADAPSDTTASDLTALEALLKELEQELKGAFQDAHNTGFYINEYTTKINALGDKLLEGFQRVVRKIQAGEEAEASLPDGSSGKQTTRQRNRARVQTILKKLVYLMSSMQIKSGSELVFPMLFCHMSFSTHRCWEMNMKVPYAKALSAWAKHFGGSLKALHSSADLAVRVGYISPSSTTGPEQALPPNWLIMPLALDASLSANESATMKQVEKETGESRRSVYISPQGQRFTSLQQALKHHNNRGLRQRLAERPVHGDHIDQNQNAHVQFTSNFGDYMHRGSESFLANLPLYFYNMWVFSTNIVPSRRGASDAKQDPLGIRMLEYPFDESYGNVSKLRKQRISLQMRIPQIEGIYIPSPDVDPHKMSLIKLLLFKPIHSAGMDDKGLPEDPFSKLFVDVPPSTAKKRKAQIDNPYDAFPNAWNRYWQEIVLPNARAAEQKMAVRKEWPTLWECLEVFQALKQQALKLAEANELEFPSDEAFKDEHGYDPAEKLANRLTVTEYCCLLTKKLVQHLNAMGRAKSMPKTKSYALDADAVEDPGLVREQNDTGGEFDATLDDVGDPDLDGQIKLKAGDAPQKVFHPLNNDARLQVLAFHRQKMTKFVRDMVAAGLLPLTNTSETLEATAAHRPAATEVHKPSTRLAQELLRDRMPRNLPSVYII